MARMSTDLTDNGLSFYALASGPVPSPFEKDNRYFPTDMVPLSVLDLGVLRVPSGRVEACDPFVTLCVGPVVEVEPGDYPVMLTRAADGTALGLHIDLGVVGGEESRA